jgi:hypothetical protein
MIFKKDPGCLIGHCKVIIKAESRIINYLFTENGYELLEDVVKE